MARREASVMNSPYSASRTRSFASLSAWTVCVRCVIQVVTMVAAAPTRDPQAAAIAVMMVESMDSGTGVEEQKVHVRHAWPDYREVFGAGSVSASEKGSSDRCALHEKKAAFLAEMSAGIGLPVAGGHKTSLTVGNGGNSLEIELLRMAGDESDSG